MSKCYQSLTAHQHQKGHTMPKTADNDCNVNSSRYIYKHCTVWEHSLSGQVWTKCPTRPDTQGVPRGGCSLHREKHDRLLRNCRTSSWQVLDCRWVTSIKKIRPKEWTKLDKLFYAPYTGIRVPNPGYLIHDQHTLFVSPSGDQFSRIIPNERHSRITGIDIDLDSARLTHRRKVPCVELIMCTLAAGSHTRSLYHVLDPH